MAVVRRIPATLIVVALTAAAWAVTTWLTPAGSIEAFVRSYGYGLPALADGRVWTLFTGLFIAQSPLMYVAAAIVFAVGAGYIEYHSGAWRMLAVALAAQVVSVVTTALILLGLGHTNVAWAIELGKVYDVGLSNAAFGVLGAATAGFSQNWRRRTRLLTLIYCSALILYAGYIWDLTHLGGFLVGMALAPWAFRRAYTRAEYPLLSLSARTLAASLATISVASEVVTRVYPGNGGITDFNHVDPRYSASFVGSALLTFLIGIFIYGLYKGKKAAWWCVLVLGVLSLLTDAASGDATARVTGIVIDGLLVAVLIIARKRFRVQSDKLARRKILRYAVLGALAMFAVHVSLIYGLRRSYTPEPTIGQAAVIAVVETLGASPDEFKSSNPAVNVVANTAALAWSVFLLTLVAGFIYATTRNHDRRKWFPVFDKLMREEGSISITWMARWDGMAYWTNEAQTAAFAYRLINNVAIVLADPVGSPSEVDAAIPQFHALCARNGWTPAYFSVSDEQRTMLAQHGSKDLVVGEDTIITLSGLEFTGKDWQSVRSAQNKAAKAGITMKSFALADAPLAIRDQLQAIADSWAADKALPEMGFTLGTLKEAADPEVVLCVAVDGDGTVHGMTSWMPVYRDGRIIGRTIDIMQRRLSDQTMGGVIEYLIAQAALAFRDQGAEFISLSAAPLAGAEANESAVGRLLYVLAERLEPYYGFKSLYRFKQKFQPEHKPLYLCYADDVQLPAIAASIGKAYMNEASYVSAVARIVRH